MQTAEVGIREFRENLASYLESGKPLAITRHGETLGFYIPAHKRNRQAQIKAMRAAAQELDQMISALDAGEEQLPEEYKQIRRKGREQRNAK